MNTDVILVWGSNPQEAHPIIYNWMRRGVKAGAQLVLIDPRRLPIANAAKYWLPVQPGTDIALANAMAHVIIEEKLYNREFIENSTRDFDDFAREVRRYTPESVEQLTGVDASHIRAVARLYAQAPRAMISWTLGITEHHNGADNVHALINLALLTGHVGKPGCGLMPLRGQNNVQGGADMGALPDKLPGYGQVESPADRERVEKAWNCTIQPKNGLTLSRMFDAMHMGEMQFVYIIGENPVQSDANSTAVEKALKSVHTLVVQEMFLTKTAELADVVLPAAGWSEVEGTYTNSQRGVQRVRKVANPPGEAKDDIFIFQELANRLGFDWNYESAQDVWDELRQLSPMHRGMTYERLDREGQLQWPCVDVDQPSTLRLHTDLHDQPGQRLVPFVFVEYDTPAEPVNDEFPFVLITGRRLPFYNTGVTTSDYGPTVKGQSEYLEMNEVDMEQLGIHDGDTASVSSKRGTLSVEVRASAKMQRGHVFMSFHFPDQVNPNLLTSDTTDKKSGVAPYKYTAVKISALSMSR